MTRRPDGREKRKEIMATRTNLGYPEDMNTTTNTKQNKNSNLGVINAASRRLLFRKLLVVNLTSLSFAEIDNPSKEAEDNSYYYYYYYY